MRRFLSLFTMLMLCGVLAFAQTRVVSGKVTDKDGAAIPFATIRIKGSKFGVSADANGAYSLKVKEGDIIQITANGIKITEATIGTQNNITTVVERTTSELVGVVVTAFGTKRQPRELGYTTSKISAASINRVQGTNVATALSGKVAGLQITLANNSVSPSIRITLRGNRSILGNNQALLVVDDIEVPISYLATINPADLENATILKGASASALYGSQGSNGVIIVNTKNGTVGKPQLRLSSAVTFESIAYTPKLQNEFGLYGGENDPNAYPGIVQIGDNPYIYYVPYENQSYGPRFNGQRVPVGSPIRVFYPDGSYKITQDSTNYSGNANALKNFFNQGLTFTKDVSYSTGDDHSKFYFGFQDATIKGVLPKDESHRNTFRLNGFRESGKFKLAYNIAYTLTHINTTAGTGAPFTSTARDIGGGYAGGGSYFQNRPVYWTLLNTNSMIDLQRYRNWQNDPFANPDGYYNAYYGNPWWQIDQSRLDERNNDLISNLSFNYTPANWISFKYNIGIIRNDYHNQFTQAGYTFADWAIKDTLGAGNIPSGVKKLSPTAGDAFTYSQTLRSKFFISLKKDYKSINAKLLLGTTYDDKNYGIVSNSAGTLVLPNFYNISNRIGEPTATELKFRTREAGYFADLVLGFNNYLFLHGSVRNDITSVLSPDNRSFTYPAGDISFVFTDAINALKGNKILNYGKISAAYSKVGQVNVGPYQLQNVFASGNGFPFNTAGYTVGNDYANPNLLPEFSFEKEIGYELQFLNNRIKLEGAFYNTKTTQQTIPITISTTTGFTRAFVNSGEISNKGYEVELNVTPLLKTRGGLKWDVSANYSYNKNVLESLGFGANEVPIFGSSFATVGKAYPQIKVQDWKRDDQNRIIVDKQTGYPSLDASPKYFGTSVPPTKIGIGTVISYKGFTFSAQAEGRFGAVIYNAAGNALDFTGVSAYSASSGRQPFVIPNSSYSDGAGKYIANTNINTQDGNNLFWANVWNTSPSNYVNSADFWKLRELALEYSLPKSLLNSTRIRAINFSVFARNLITLRAKDNIWSDPEFSNTIGNGVGTTDINQLPPVRSYGLSLSVTF
jgi:TonB-linked SusC/RagA family outer membrane protein